jgi:hypothetical protein
MLLEQFLLLFKEEYPRINDFSSFILGGGGCKGLRNGFKSTLQTLNHPVNFPTSSGKKAPLLEKRRGNLDTKLVGTQ